jgi:hypothetical protein
VTVPPAPPIAGSAAIGAPAPGPAGPGPRLTVRPTTPADLPAVVSLLSERDGRPLEPANVASALYGLDRAHLAGWLAFADDQPAGLTTLYTRDQRWEVGGQTTTIRAGYWSHLFVREEFRRLMVYPQLVLAMMRGIKPLGIDCIFTGTRRPNVAQGHVKLGFARLGEYRVLFKPLRPFRLVARYKGWPGLTHAAAAPGDALYGVILAARRRGARRDLTIRAVDAGGPAIEAVVALLNTTGAGRVSQVWTRETLLRRLSRTIDGCEYRVLIAERGGRTIGAAVYRLTVRERVVAGVIMELVAAPGEDDALPALLTELERRLRAESGDTTLFLDALGPEASRLLTSRGHRTSRETYQMLVWPKTLVPAGAPAADLSNWRFSFLDHDAF